MNCKFLLPLFLLTALLPAQEQSDLRLILERLQRIEQQNQALVAEVQSLRKEIAASRATAAEAPAEAGPAPPLAERVDVQERRTEELAQTKVESEHRMPVQLTGMLLFNTYWNGQHAGDQNNPVVASPVAGQSGFGATLRQSVIGLKFQGPQLFGGGKASGSLFMDLYGGTGTPNNALMRIRVATLDLTWNRTTVSFAQDKPIISPREPNSLAQVGVSPLTAAGNPWLWQPQIRLEQRFYFGDTAGLRMQGGVYLTNESTAGVPPELLDSLARSRPGLEARAEFWKDWNGRRIEIAPGVHYSNSHVAGMAVPSRVYSVDWLLRPFKNVDVTGMFFTGENTQVLGTLRPGITYFPDGRITPVGATGGWAQLTLRITSRTWMNFYAGQQSNQSADLVAGSAKRNLVYAGNVMHKLSSNVLAGFEASQVRTTYLGSGTRTVPHYDLSLAYLF